MLSYENGIATDNLPNEYYVVQIDGESGWRKGRSRMQVFVSNADLRRCSTSWRHEKPCACEANPAALRS